MVDHKFVYPVSYSLLDYLYFYDWQDQIEIYDAPFRKCQLSISLPALAAIFVSLYYRYLPSIMPSQLYSASNFLRWEDLFIVFFSSIEISFYHSFPLICLILYVRKLSMNPDYYLITVMLGRFTQLLRVAAPKTFLSFNHSSSFSTLPTLQLSDVYLTIFRPME